MVIISLFLIYNLTSKINQTMKEYKKFFSNENRLNKGYAFTEEQEEDKKEENNEIVTNEVTYITQASNGIDKQKLILQSEAKLHFINRMSNVFILGIISYTTIFLAKNNYHQLAVMFIIASFLSIIFISFLQSYKKPQNRKAGNENIRHFPNKYKKSQRFRKN